MLVSVLIPVYNAENYLEATVKSCLVQTYRPLEIILVDDGSTDNSLRIARSLESDCVKVFSQVNSGACRARNKAFAESTGDYIQYLDADDLLASDKIEVQMNKLKGSTNIMANGRWGRFYTNDPFSEEIKWGPHKLLQRDLKPVDWLCQNHMSATHCWLTPRELILRAGAWDESLSQNQDGDFFTRTMVNAEMICYTDHAKSYYRSSLKNSVSNNTRDSAKIRSRFKVCESFEKLILSLEDSPRTRLAVSNQYQQFIYSAFPLERSLIKKAEAKVKMFGGSNWMHPLGGKASSVLTRVLGWRTVVWLKSFWH